MSGMEFGIQPGTLDALLEQDLKKKKEEQERVEKERKEIKDHKKSQDEVDPNKNRIASNMAIALEQSSEEEDVEEQEIIKAAEPSPEVSESIQQKVAQALENPKNASADNILDQLTKDNNYRKVMQELDSELSEGEEALSKDLAGQRDSANLQELIRTGIQAAAVMFAASKGISTKLESDIPSPHTSRLKEAQEDINNRRRILRSRIKSAKQLTKDLHSHQTSEEVREVTREERQERLQEKNEKARIRKQEQQATIELYNSHQRIKYDIALENQRQRFQKEWDKLKGTKEQEAFIKRIEPTISEEKLKEVLGKDQILYFIDTAPNAAYITEALRDAAIATVPPPQKKAGGLTPSSNPPPSSPPSKSSNRTLVRRFSDGFYRVDPTTNEKISKLTPEEESRLRKK